MLLALQGSSTGCSVVVKPRWSDHPVTCYVDISESFDLRHTDVELYLKEER